MTPEIIKSKTTKQLNDDIQEIEYRLSDEKFINQAPSCVIKEAQELQEALMLELIRRYAT